jgi:hypothetical protein
MVILVTESSLPHSGGDNSSGKLGEQTRWLSGLAEGRESSESSVFTSLDSLPNHSSRDFTNTATDVQSLPQKGHWGWTRPITGLGSRPSQCSSPPWAQV